MTGQLSSSGEECDRCGKEKVTTMDQFFRIFGKPDMYTKEGVNLSLAAVKNESGELMPIKGKDDEKFVWLPEQNEYVELWDDAEVVDARREAQKANEKCICNWCYQTHRITKYA